MRWLRCSITRYVDNEPQPGMVEARFVDAYGQEWVLVDKVPMFSTESLTRESEYPVDGVIGCEILTEMETITRVQLRWNDAVSGECEFDVHSDQLLSE
jgi:hypothetical protein